jgi:hypothetical protein
MEKMQANNAPGRVGDFVCFFAFPFLFLIINHSARRHRIHSKRAGDVIRSLTAIIREDEEKPENI